MMRREDDEGEDERGVFVTVTMKSLRFLDSWNPSSQDDNGVPQKVPVHSLYGANALKPSRKYLYSRILDSVVNQ